MKSILIISSVTFLLIFGGIAALVASLGPAGAAVPEEGADASAAARLLREAAVERDRLQGEAERLAGLRQSQAAQEEVMAQVHAQLLGIVGKIESQQATYVSEQDAAATRLAKMYEAMKPDAAATILQSLDIEITLAILSRMKERQAARVLSLMDPGRAAQISTRLSLQQGA